MWTNYPHFSQKSSKSKNQKKFGGTFGRISRHITVPRHTSWETLAVHITFIGPNSQSKKYLKFKKLRKYKNHRYVEYFWLWYNFFILNKHLLCQLKWVQINSAKRDSDKWRHNLQCVGDGIPLLFWPQYFFRREMEHVQS